MFDYEKEHLDRLRPFLSECTVLLKSDGSFPIDGACDVALFGSGARGTIKGGTGSGEVNSRFFINIEKGLTDRGFNVTSGNWLDSYEKVRASARKKFVKDIKSRARKKHVLPVKYDPHRRRYIVSHKPINDNLRDRIVEDCIKINKTLGYDMNTVEFAIKDGIPYSIDFMNPVPDCNPEVIQEEYFTWVVDKLAEVAIEYGVNSRDEHPIRHV